MSDESNGLYKCQACGYRSLGNHCRVLGCGPRVPWRDSEALYHRHVTTDTDPADGWPLLSCGHRAPRMERERRPGRGRVPPPVGLVFHCAECERA